MESRLSKQQREFKKFRKSKLRFSFFILLKSRTSLTKPVDPLWLRSNKQTHKLEFYLNTHETRRKKGRQEEISFQVSLLFSPFISPKLAIYGTSFDKAF